MKITTLAAVVAALTFAASAAGKSSLRFEDGGGGPAYTGSCTVSNFGETQYLHPGVHIQCLATGYWHLVTQPGWPIVGD